MVFTLPITVQPPSERRQLEQQVITSNMQQMFSEVCADVVFRLSLGHVFTNLTPVCGKEENK
jgi:hypothetical protein